MGIIGQIIVARGFGVRAHARDLEDGCDPWLVVRERVLREDDDEDGDDRSDGAKGQDEADKEPALRTSCELQ